MGIYFYELRIYFGSVHNFERHSTLGILSGLSFTNIVEIELTTHSALANCLATALTVSDCHLLIYFSANFLSY